MKKLNVCNIIEKEAKNIPEMSHDSERKHGFYAGLKTPHKKEETLIKMLQRQYLFLTQMSNCLMCRHCDTMSQLKNCVSKDVYRKEYLQS